MNTECLLSPHQLVPGAEPASAGMRRMQHCACCAGHQPYQAIRGSDRAPEAATCLHTLHAFACQTPQLPAHCWLSRHCRRAHLVAREVLQKEACDNDFAHGLCVVLWRNPLDQSRKEICHLH